MNLDKIKEDFAKFYDYFPNAIWIPDEPQHELGQKWGDIWRCEEPCKCLLPRIREIESISLIDCKINYKILWIGKSLPADRIDNYKNRKSLAYELIDKCREMNAIIYSDTKREICEWLFKDTEE